MFTEQFRYDARGRIAGLTPLQGGGFVRTWWQGLADALPFAYSVSIIPSGGGSSGGANGGENPPGSSAYPSWLAADDLTFAAAGDHALVEGAEWESTFMLLRNHRGDTVAVVEPNGTFREVYVYGLWGDSTVFGCTTSSGSGTPGNTCTIPRSNSTLGNSSQFAGTHRSPLTNVYHMGARWYSTALRQFISRDPLGQAVSFDEWLYTVGDPMNFVDRLGLSPDGVSGQPYMNHAGAAWDHSKQSRSEERATTEYPERQPIYAAPGVADQFRAFAVQHQIQSANGGDQPLVLALRNISRDRLEAAFPEWFVSSGGAPLTPSEINARLEDIALPTEIRSPTDGGSQDVFVIIDGDTVEVHEATLGPTENPTRGVPRVNGDEHPDVGMVRPGEYLLEYRANGHDGGPAATLRSPNNPSGVDDLHTAVDRNTNFDLSISFEEIQESRETGRASDSSRQIDPLIGYYATHVYLHLDSFYTKPNGGDRFESHGCLTGPRAAVERIAELSRADGGVYLLLLSFTQ